MVINGPRRYQIGLHILCGMGVLNRCSGGSAGHGCHYCWTTIIIFSQAETVLAVLGSEQESQFKYPGTLSEMSNSLSSQVNTIVKSCWHSEEMFPVATKPNLAQIVFSRDHLSICDKCHPDASLEKCARHGQLRKGPGANPEHAGGAPAQQKRECWGSHRKSCRKSMGKNEWTDRRCTATALQLNKGYCVKAWKVFTGLRDYSNANSSVNLFSSDLTTCWHAHNKLT